MFTSKRTHSLTQSIALSNSERSIKTAGISFQSVEDDVSQSVDSYGCPLPVRVSEAMSISKGHALSVGISNFGWAWLVAGQRALVWNYACASSARPGPCRELPLPFCQTAHSSDRFCVLPSADGALQAFFATAEGHLRFWANIMQENNFLEHRLPLSDQVVRGVLYVKNHSGVVIYMNMCVIYRLTFGKSGIVCCPLLESASSLLAVSRRMSSFIFGGSSSENSVKTPLVSICSTNSGSGEEYIYALTDRHLQKISFDSRAVVFEANVHQMVRESLRIQNIALVADDQLWLVDLTSTKLTVLILVAFLNNQSLLQFALVYVKTSSLIAPTDLQSIIPLSYSLVVSEPRDIPGLVEAHRLLYPCSLYQTAYIYARNCLFVVSTTNSSSPVDKIEFETVLGLGVHITTSDAIPLLFTAPRGLVSIRSSLPSDLHLASFVEDPSTGSETANNSILTRSDEPGDKTSGSPASALKAAFMTWLKDGQPRGPYVLEQFGVSLHSPDQGVMELSQRILDDIPLNDPRWAESHSSKSDHVPLANSILLMNQLEGKLKVHRLFLTFLTSTGLMDKLTFFKGFPSRQQLFEHSEKVVAAKAIREVHIETPHVVDGTIKRCIQARSVFIPASLTPSDVFYREVSRISDFLYELIQYEEGQLARLTTFIDIVALISNVNILLITCILEVTKYREAAFLSRLFDRKPDHVPWTKKDDIRQLLIKQCGLTVQHALPSCETAQDNGTVSQQLADIIDIVCDSFVSAIHASSEQPSPELESQYRAVRYKLLQPFIESEQYERAAELAEKYLDFRILIELCERTDNSERLARYQERYSGHGFSELLFGHYVKEGKRSKLLSQPAVALPDLENFLQKGGNSDLRWLHSINIGDYIDAHKVMAQLALGETDHLAKKKTLFSLSKLAGYASDDAADIAPALEAISSQLLLIKHQEMLPEEVVQSLGMDSNNMSVLAPHELIEAYIHPSNIHATEMDFKRALDLIAYCDQDYREATPDQLRLHIWCQAILRDRWDYSSDDPLLDCRDKIFFRLIEIIAASLEGEELLQEIPTIDSLLSSPELISLRKSTTLEYLLQAGYEHLKHQMEADIV